MLFNTFFKSISYLRFEYNFMSVDNFSCVSVTWFILLVQKLFEKTFLSMD